MNIDANFKLMERIDVSQLEQFVQEVLRPHYAGDDSLLWELVRDRSRYIGLPDRPGDIAFRKMRPSSYMQLCVLNEESPFSPWALPMPVALERHDVLKSLIHEMSAVCCRHYGTGSLNFCVFAILGPKGEIPPHRDMPHDINKKRYSHHLHIPLTQADTTVFTVGGEVFRMEQGGVYEINNMRVHSVSNGGDGYRVNLMLDYCCESAQQLRSERSPDLNLLTLHDFEQKHVD